MIPEISPSEFVRRRDAGEDLLLLDVREPRELQVASVPGALHIPMGEVPGRLGEIDRNREVVVLCRSGGRSLRVAMFLAQQGFGRVANLHGGILRWAEELDPTMATY
jgi:adenylyltransferase/sulfurtransferase